MVSILERPLYRAFQLLEAYAKFKPMRLQTLARLPRPRLKKWYERLDETKHDGYYKQAQRLGLDPGLRGGLRGVYRRICEERLMGQVLRVQKFLRRVSYQ